MPWQEHDAVVHAALDLATTLKDHMKRFAITPLGLALSTMAGLAMVLVTACGPSFEEGTIRPLVKESRAGIVTLKGAERFTDGEWLKHGETIFYDDDGDEIARGHYLRGVEDGPWTQLYDDGCRGAGSFKEGLRDGPWETFHKNGVLQDTGSYEKHERIGNWVSYRPDGTPLRQGKYTSGKLNGQVTWYLKDGKSIDKNRSGVYEDGVLNVGR